jgi:hypothetical protein
MPERLKIGKKNVVVLRSKSKKVLGVYDAQGGPLVADKGGDGHPRGQTPDGRFFVAYRQKHKSPSRYPLAKIEWGTKLRKNRHGEFEAETSPNKWELVQYLTGIETSEIIELNRKVYKKKEIPKEWVFEERDNHGNIDPAGRWNFIPPYTAIKVVNGVPMVTIGSETMTVKQATGYKAIFVEAWHQQTFGKASGVPQIWRLNDFGHITVYIFSDRNGNKKFDSDLEKVNGEMFHTTPDNEAEAERRRKDSKVKVKLVDSHGCVHMDPDQFDAMINAGYFDNNTEVNVYKYTEDMPDINSLGGIQKGVKPFAIHFFPKDKKIIVTGS